MYSIQDVSNKTGLSAHTLRYYEKEGLICGVERSRGGFRQYSDEDLESLGLICCLKNTGMSLQEIARFVELTRAGDHTLAERVELLRQHRENVIDAEIPGKGHLEAELFQRKAESVRGRDSLRRNLRKDPPEP